MRTDFVKVSDDLTIHYLTAGAGKQVILLVPGWTMTSLVFERQLNYFEDSQTYKVVAIDPRSHGISTHTSEGNFYEQHGRDLNAFIVALDLQGVVLGGWSNGGFTILSYVHQFGSANVKGLIMIDAAPKGSGLDNSPASQEWVWFRKDDGDGFKASITLGALHDRQKMNDEFARWMIDDPTADYLTWISGITNQTGNDVAALLNESSAYQDYDAVLKNLEGRIPLLYFVNSEWQAVNNWSSRNTPSASIVRFGKHLAFWEHAETFNNALNDYLKKVD